MDSEVLEQRYSQTCRKHARRFFKAVQRQQSAQPSFLSLMTFTIQQFTWSREDPQTYDYQYWLAQGWTDPRSTFYFPHKANPLKVGLARLVGGVMARLMS